MSGRGHMSTRMAPVSNRLTAEGAEEARLGFATYLNGAIVMRNPPV
jgi:hypothetical protein